AAIGGDGKSGWIDGNPGQILTQVEGIAFTVVYCAIASFVIFKVLDMVLGLRVEAEVERDGLDLALHGEAVL
ncbi:MAG TPA: ammonia channel protein, partial [Aliidongia sp.]|nr:ammonia channel protein [Aliidongia sp.]